MNLIAGVLAAREMGTVFTHRGVNYQAEYDSNGNMYIVASGTTTCPDTVEILEGTRVIQERGFQHCTNLKSVHLPDSLDTIRSFAFSHLANLRYVSNLNQMTIMSSAFSHSGVENLELNKVVCLDRSFAHCKAKTVSIEDCNLYPASFIRCEELRSLTVVNTKYRSKHSFTRVVSAGIGSDAFHGCSSLRQVTLKGILKIGFGAFDTCVRLEAVKADSNLKEIGDSAFSSCSSLKEIDLQHCTTIGASAFNRCKALREIDLRSCQSVGGLAFYSCTGLQTALWPKRNNLKIDAFSDCYNLKTVYVPWQFDQRETTIVHHILNQSRSGYVNVIHI